MVFWAFRTPRWLRTAGLSVSIFLAKKPKKDFSRSVGTIPNANLNNLLITPLKFQCDNSKIKIEFLTLLLSLFYGTFYCISS